MTPPDLLTRLVTHLPDFAAHWDDPGNCFRNDDGAFNYYGLFAELASFLGGRRTTKAERVAVGALLSECMAPSPEEVDNAAATCFIEPVAGTPLGRALRPHLTGEARRYYEVWDA